MTTTTIYASTSQHYFCFLFNHVFSSYTGFFVAIVGLKMKTKNDIILEPLPLVVTKNSPVEITMNDSFFQFFS